ncbi:MAG TPA: hypothetical protein VHH88_11185, partial [Verrucomicrobiae bacterium]|nr:hypothetical protein [Verrucomicrobiae bacterium]
MKNLLPCLLMLAAAGAPIAPQMAAAAGTNAVSTVAAGDAKLNQLFGDPVIAKGKGIEIKQSELDAEVSRTKTVLASRGGTVPPGIEPQVLDGLIGLKLLIAKATPEDRAKATEQFEKSFASYKKAQDLTDAEFKERLAPELKIEGRTMDEWRKQQIDQATIPIVLERELKIRITPDEAKKFYEDNPSKFETAEMV